jgi:hypothetical protein
MNANEVKNGTILVSNSNWGPIFVQVTDRVTDRWGTHLVCTVLNSDRRGEFETVHSVGPEEMRGIGWKIPTASELVRMQRYVATAA